MSCGNSTSTSGGLAAIRKRVISCSAVSSDRETTSEVRRPLGRASKSKSRGAGSSTSVNRAAHHCRTPRRVSESSTLRRRSVSSPSMPSVSAGAGTARLLVCSFARRPGSGTPTRHSLEVTAKCTLLPTSKMSPLG